MNRNYYYEKMAQQRERENSQKADFHRLFGDVDRPTNVKLAGQVARRLAPVMIFLTWLLFYFLG